MTFRVFVPSLQGNATQVRLAAVGNEFARWFYSTNISSFEQMHGEKMIQNSVVTAVSTA